MAHFWKSFFRTPYRVSKIVHTFSSDTDLDRAPSPVQLVCDIDKTYLESSFESLIGMAKIAFEDAEQKITVAGAETVLKLYRWGNEQTPSPTRRYPQGLHFLSSSPVQLRGVIEHKLALDGLDWSSVTLKDQAYNLKKGHMALLKQHAVYKTSAIIGLMGAYADRSNFYFVGDDVEFDLPIYVGIAAMVDKIFDGNDLVEYLSLLDRDAPKPTFLPEQIDKASSHRVAGIYIRSVKGSVSPPQSLPTPIHFFGHWFDLGVSLVVDGAISRKCASELAQKCHNSCNLDPGDMARTVSGILAVRPQISCKLSDFFGFKEEGWTRSFPIPDLRSKIWQNGLCSKEGVMEFGRQWRVRDEVK